MHFIYSMSSLSFYCRNSPEGKGTDTGIMVSDGTAMELFLCTDKIRAIQAYSSLYEECGICSLHRTRKRSPNDY